MEKYNHKKIEKKWQKEWEKTEPNKVDEKSKLPKYYSLVEFPYPSGDGLHVGHVRSYTAMDIISRKRRREGFNVLYPMGYDAFGLPAENYAVKTGVHPKITTEKSIKIFRKQLKSLGFSFDWSRELETIDPKYYKWTQWIFLQLFKNGLAYKKKIPINWCLDCKIGLANEEVVGGLCERCGGEIEKREKEQWMLAITKYADRLLDGLNEVDYIRPVKIQQRNWIGKSHGAEIAFPIKDSSEEIRTFTTRPDTLFGATYMVLAPEHEIIPNLKSQISNWGEVSKYIEKSKSKTDIERTTEGKGKTGIELKGLKAINPANNEELPIFVADYVLIHYGTGAIMAVPAHDERDLEFAKRYKLSVREVILPQIDADRKKAQMNADEVYTGEGKMVNSGEFDGMDSEKVIEAITKKVGGEMKVIYKLRDWVFSRQRYWGEPIPMILCSKCGPVPVPEEDLPVELPQIEDFMPSDSGESPLAKAEDWVNVACPKCSQPAKRETDVMPNWAGSSWYFLRYLDPQNDKALADKKKIEKWMPVDWYNGGMEHTTLHLLYSRFWYKFLFDIGVVHEDEPYKKRTSHGVILGEDNEKMSKSRGNVINPDNIIEKFGVDTLRLYEMFLGPFDQMIAWSMDGLMGPRRFLDKLWRLQKKVVDKKTDAKLKSMMHQTIKKVSDDIEEMKFNTAVSAMMVYLNHLGEEKEVSRESFTTLLFLLAPFAPHITEELWQRLKENNSIHLTPWPAYDKNMVVQKKHLIVIQVNGKVRGKIETEKSNEEEIKREALSLERVSKYLKDKEIKKTIYVKDKLLNIVI